MDRLINMFFGKLYKKIYRNFGLFALLKIYTFGAFKKTIKINIYGDNIYFRASDKSDLRAIIDYVNLENHYIKYLADSGLVKNPLTFLDLGCNLGLETLVAYKYLVIDKAVLVDLDKINLTIAKKNTTIIENCSYFERAISTVSGEIVYFNPTLEANSFKIINEFDRKNKEVLTLSVSELLQKSCLDGEKIFLKMDIEGAEKLIFFRGNDLSWLDKIKLIYIEYHQFSDADLNEIITILQQKNLHILNTFDYWNYPGWGGILAYNKRL